MIENLRFRSKLTLLSGASILTLGVFAALAYSTLRAVKIASPLYNDISLAYSLAGDCYDPPASLVAALPPAIAAEDSTNPAETQKYVALLRQEHQAFEDSQKHYDQALPPGPIKDVLRNETYPTGEQWFSIAEAEYIPALLTGDHEAARKIRIAKMNPLFAQHKAGNDKLSTLTANWIPSQEKVAANFTHSRILFVGAISLFMAGTILLLAYRIIESIAVPVRQMLTCLNTIASGDLTATIHVDSRDEMRDMAEAVNHTATAFRQVISSVSLATNTLAAAVAQLTATAEDTTRGVRNNAQDTQLVSVAMDEMSSVISGVAGSAEAASRTGDQTEAAASNGQTMIKETLGVIRRAAGAAAQASTTIETLGVSSERIGSIAGVIDEIASQTNLLALNAAIEAARAGEHGRGFAVVAAEVRRLAERTTSATKEIAGMIEAIQRETGNAVSSMELGQNEVKAGLAKAEACGLALDQIVLSAHQARAMVQRIAESTGSQTQVAARVAASIHTISEFTTHASASQEQTVEACASLTKMATELHRQIESFRVD